MFSRLNAIQHIGQLVALPFCAFACDRYGRRTTIVASAVLLLSGVAIQAGAQSCMDILHYSNTCANCTEAAMFIAARGLIGFGIAFNFTAAPLLIMELAFPTQKSSLVGFFNAQWSE